MNVLALDTATEHGSVALARDGRLVEARPLPPGWSNTSLHGEIAKLLAEHGLTTRDIDGFGVTSGPGSFTGVRVGLTAVKGLAEVHGKPIATVSTLLAVAASAQLSTTLSRAMTFVALLDARRGQVFGGVYGEEGGRWTAVIEESVSSLPLLLDRLHSSLKVSSEPQVQIAFCGIDLERYATEIQKAGWSSAPMIQVSPCLAGPLAQIATNLLGSGLGAEAGSAEANYVRISDAELFWKG